ncbi:MAG: toxin-antitoxin system YwqK family antitoxin [Bacteroidota bacterium]
MEWKAKMDMGIETCILIAQREKSRLGGMLTQQFTIFILFTILTSCIFGQNNQDTIHYFSKLYPEDGMFLRPDSLPDGEWIAFCESNKTQIGLKLHYKNGNRNGESISYWANGNIQQKGNYKNGCLDGKNEKWYKNGTKESENFCELDDLKKHVFHCKFINYWLKDGRQLIKDGTGKYISYHDNDTIQVVGEYLDGLQTGKWTWQYANGAIQYIENFKKGKRNGEYIYYYINGQIRDKGIYSNGEQIGKWEGWYEDGNNQEYETRIDGKRDGEYKYWHRNGQLNTIGKYKLGKKDGAWKHWDANGKLEMEEKYIDGNLIESKNYK